MLEIVSVSSGTPDDNTQPLPIVNSMARFGVRLNIHWTRHKFTNSYDLKLLFVRSILEASKSPYTLYLDAYDTILVRPIDNLVETFLSFDKRIVIGTERGGDPRTNFLYPEAPFKNRYLNAGCFMGERESLIEAISEIIQNESFHSFDNYRDQPMWSRYFLQNQHKIGLDYECRLFQTITPGYKPTGLKKIDGHVACSFSGQMPFVLHAQSSKYLDPNTKLLDQILTFIEGKDGDFDPPFESTFEEQDVIAFDEI